MDVFGDVKRPNSGKMGEYKITFGTSGWRERTDSGFNLENVARVAYGIGRYLNAAHASNTMIVGYDTRENSEEFAEAICAVLSGMGIDVFITDAPVPTPALSFAVKNRGYDGGIIVTASHNPKIYNGIKFMDSNGATPVKEVTDRITALIPDYAVKIPEYRKNATSIKEEYLSALSRRLNLEKVKDMHVVVDTLYGSGRGYLAELLRRYGAKVIELHNSYRSDFGGMEAPNPTEENTHELAIAIREYSADIGIASDGDADRVAILDENGRYYTANESGLMLCDYLLGYRKELGPVAKSIQTTSCIDRLCSKYGVEYKEVAVGFKNIAVEFLNGAVFGIEGAAMGIGIGNWILDKDGIMAGALACEMLAEEGVPLSKIWEKLSKELGYGSFLTLAVEKKDGMDKAIVRLSSKKVGEEFAGKAIGGISLLDGVKISFKDNSWLLVRASGTEPVVRIYAEGKNNGEANALLTAAKKFLEENGNKPAV